MKAMRFQTLVRIFRAGFTLGVGAALWTIPAASAAEAGFGFTGHGTALGERVYREHCAACHDSGAARAPQPMLMQDMTPRAIHRALTEGVMRAQGAALSADEKRAVTEYLTGRTPQQTAAREPNRCTGRHAAFDLAEPPPFTGWGLDPHNSHTVPTALAGVDRATIGAMKLKWAFAFPEANRARSQPALGGGAIFVGSHNGSVYALDRETGCLRWRFEAEAEVRTGIVLSPWEAGDTSARPLAYFGDVTGNAYAVEALSGALVWKVAADPHPAATLTGTPTLHGDTLYVPVSSIEEAAAAAPDYQCCSFRGSILALDAASGREKWRTWLAEPATPQGLRSDGMERLGPSGVAVWSSPAVDARRGQLYIATSDNYSAPATAMSDSILALDLATGAIRWRYQALAGDAWNVACFTGTSHSCPENPGPDFGFGAAPILAQGSDGREYVLAGQKSGWAFGIAPDTGELAWKQRVGSGGVAAGIYFGMAANEGRLFVPVTDRPDGKDYGFPARPGLHALDIATGEILWYAPADNLCGENRACDPGFGSAITATPELVFTGADDGRMRVFDARSGERLWELDTTRAFPAVNGATARGGAIGGGAAPLAYKGTVIVSSGYGYASKLPGNLLLVFETE